MADITIVLTQHSTHTFQGSFDTPGAIDEYWPSGSRNPERDEQILISLKDAAAAAGIAFETSSKQRSSGGEGSGTLYQGGFGGSTDLYEIVSVAGPYAAYVGGAAAGMAVFVRNVLGSMAEWKKLREGRTVEIKVKGKRVSIKDGSDVDKVLTDIRKSLGIGETEAG
ncbi:hypothetical protein FDV58_27715 [Bradyrhizobium elkanii]|uniref:Uncharacterized protein n=1 Tax=Bradyrhizobium elkanii TaxID=29448 RepID=A0A4U6RV34_BRAEL|nr:hypothetical protein [Bradyrhizobium elkanii]TKV77993.1 hypothetical protein FDV58_27715 [Bradyrhizobium elkanii]